jgi:hypothetical protein
MLGRTRDTRVSLLEDVLDLAALVKDTAVKMHVGAEPVSSTRPRDPRDARVRRRQIRAVVRRAKLRGAASDECVLLVDDIRRAGELARKRRAAAEVGRHRTPGECATPDVLRRLKMTVLERQRIWRIADDVKAKSMLAADVERAVRAYRDALDGSARPRPAATAATRSRHAVVAVRRAPRGRARRSRVRAVARPGASASSSDGPAPPQQQQPLESFVSRAGAGAGLNLLVCARSRAARHFHLSRRAPLGGWAAVLSYRPSDWRARVRAMPMWSARVVGITSTLGAP